MPSRQVRGDDDERFATTKHAHFSVDSLPTTKNANDTKKENRVFVYFVVKQDSWPSI